MGITVIIPTFNEEPHIARCLEAVVDFAERVYVVDSHSTDRTVEIVRGYKRTAPPARPGFQASTRVADDRQPHGRSRPGTTPFPSACIAALEFPPPMP